MTQEECREQLKLAETCTELLFRHGIRAPSYLEMYQFDHITLVWESHKINNYEYQANLEVYPDGEIHLDVYFIGGMKCSFFFLLKDCPPPPGALPYGAGWLRNRSRQRAERNDEPRLGKP
jgi:hypothetical protein